VAREELPALLAREPDLPLNFHIDQRAPFQSFMGVLDQARLHGRDNFIITTEPGHAPNP
jgi:biopolymer transport protein ExbD